MKQLYFCRIANTKAGLCNQLFALTTGIIKAFNEKKKIVILGGFLNDYSKSNITPISDIIDISAFNNFILKNYGIHIIDTFHTNLTIHKVVYGTEDKQENITSVVIDKFYKNNTLSIDTSVQLNLLGFGDPVPFQPKYVEITYALNGIMLIEKYNELNGYLQNSIVFNVDSSNFQFDMGWIDKYNRTMFDNILKNITFLKRLHLPIAEHNYISNYHKINVIHLRLENDAIDHWSRMNNMQKPIFKNVIEQKYIQIIKNHVNKNDMNILLSFSTNNPVVQFLKQNGYNIHISSKMDEWGREVNAIKDTTSIELCNNLFIGNFNLLKLNGSSLSYYLINKLKPNMKCITIDLDRIKDNERVFTV